MAAKIKLLPVKSIRTSSKARPLNEKKLALLAKSMAEIGLQTPISVRIKKNEPVVIAGHHRLEAAKKNKWDTIDCMIMHGDKIDAKLWSIAENLHRAELDRIQRAELTDAWKNLLKDRKGAQVAQRGGRQPHDRGISATAKALGTTRDDVRRSLAVATISPKAKAAARAEGLADNDAVLLQVAKKKGAKAQVKAVRELAKRKGSKDNGLAWSQKRQLRKLTELFNAARDLKRAWNEAGLEVRKKFIARLLKTQTDTWL
jgi:ParB/RepB/Spo0J family partition protein